MKAAVPSASGVITPAFGSIKLWCHLSGDGRSKAYEHLAAGELRGIKVGRKLLIDIEDGLARRRALPSAEFGSKRAA